MVLPPFLCFSFRILLIYFLPLIFSCLKCIYVAPLKALARERLKDWQNKLGGGLNLKVLELTGDVSPDIALLKQADVLIVTPEKWDSISRGWKERDYVKQVELMILDEIHLLGVDRGPVLEIIVSRMRFIAAQTFSPIRFVGLSTALANPRDLADWLGIGEVGVYNFRPSVRPIPMSIHVSGFPGKHYCPRMATMNRPCYIAIKEHSPIKPSLIFVSSRRQTRLTALDLISFCYSDDNSKQFLHMPEDEIIAIAETLKDGALRDTIVYGIGIHHAGLDNHDRETVEHLFLTSKIQVLVCTSTLAWGVNLPCHLVIVKGTEFFDGKIGRYVDFPVTDVLQMMGRAGRPQFDDTGVACIMVHEPKKSFYKKFLFEPFPVESSLQHQLHDHINAEIAGSTLLNLADCVEFITWTYFFRRLVYNPSYYHLEDTSPEGVQKYLLQMLTDVVVELRAAQCVTFDEEDNSLLPTKLGKIASYYYLDYRTVGLFSDRIKALTSAWHSVVVVEQNEERLISDLVRLLCDAFEFAELPVRHNEDLLNAELAGTLPWETDPDSFGSAHTKAFLLMQAHFMRSSLPISDYINDTKSVLDQMPRVLNALIEIAIFEKQFYILKALIKVSAMIYTGLSFNVRELRQLPYISEELSRVCNGRNISRLTDVLKLSHSALDKLAQSLYASDSTKQREFVRVCKELPGIQIAQVNVRVLSLGDESSSGINDGDGDSRPPWLCVPLDGVVVAAAAAAAAASGGGGEVGVGVSITAVAGIQVPLNAELEIEIKISRWHGASTTKAFSSKNYKLKSPSWFVALGSANDIDLIACKRLANVGDRGSDLKFRFTLPSALPSRHDLRVYVLCDTLVGLDITKKITIFTN